MNGDIYVSVKTNKKWVHTQSIRLNELHQAINLNQCQSLSF